MVTSRKLDPRDRALLLRVALTLAAVTSVLIASTRYFRGHAALAAQLGVPESPKPFLILLAQEIPVWFGMVLLVPAILRLADAFPVRGPRRWPHLGVHLLFFPLATLAGAVMTTVGRWPLLGVQPGGFLAHVAVYFVIEISFFPMTYAPILLGHHLLVHARHLRERELADARLETRLARARLQALQSQMQPHFLFNSLTGIAALIGEDDERARRLVVDMSTLLRAYCDAEEDEVPLAEELALLDTYVALQVARFGDRLRYSRQVPEAALGLLVPHLALQPLVENAVKHAVERRLAPVEVRVTARIEGERLVLVVSDDGPGPGVQPSERIGLGNLRERLRVLYGEAQSLRLEPRPAGGTEVTLSLPATEAKSPVALEAAFA